MAKESKNLAKVQSMLDGTYGGKIQVGYGDQEIEKYEIGDRWVDSDGREWEQKKGYRMKISKLASKGIADQCNTCESFILKSWDKDTYKADGRCYHCQLNYELDLKYDKPIRWFAYRRLKDLKNMVSIEKEMVQWVDEMERVKSEKVFDKSVANALANGEVEMSIHKNKTI